MKKPDNSNATTDPTDVGIYQDFKSGADSSGEKLPLQNSAIPVLHLTFTNHCMNLHASLHVVTTSGTKCAHVYSRNRHC